MFPAGSSAVPTLSFVFVLQLIFKSQSVSGGGRVFSSSGQVDARRGGAEGRMGEEAWGPAPRLQRRSADLLSPAEKTEGDTSTRRRLKRMKMMGLTQKGSS